MLSDMEKYKLIREIISEARTLVKAGYGDVRIEKRVCDEKVSGTSKDD